MKRLLSLLAGLILLTAGTVSAGSWPITYRLTGTLSGDYTMTGDTLPPLTFTDALFLLQVTADAVDVVPVTTFNPDDLYVVGAHPYHAGPAVSGSLFIDGVGTFTFMNNLYASDSQANNLQPGIFEIGTDQEAQFIDVQHQFFENYQMMSQVNPLPVELRQDGFFSFAVAEAGGTSGDLTLTGASSLLFEAVGGVPEPSTFLLLGAGLAGLIAMRRRRR